MDELDAKIEAANKLIERVVANYKRSVLMSSFGKDSMVLLEIVKQMGLRFPILFHREPFFPKKYEFANGVIAQNNYTVYDYAPASTSISKNGQELEIINWYQVGPAKFAYVPTGIRTPRDGEPFLCGYQDLYLKAFGSFAFPWDVAFLGHKSSDHDPILGAIPLQVDIKVNDGGPDYAYPLRHFTDADVWEYHKRFNVPVNEKRYDLANNFKECADITFNPDYHHACVRCMDRDEPSVVFCPKLGCEIPNISREIRYIEPALPSYVTTPSIEADGFSGNAR